CVRQSSGNIYINSLAVW
nr:immunoglobulin heavy chain junction region [Macaca mulatta]MOV46809.1 immunoglobulin heavy chain junction region [Macaca mulatta]